MQRAVPMEKTLSEWSFKRQLFKTPDPNIKTFWKSANNPFRAVYRYFCDKMQKINGIANISGAKWSLGVNEHHKQTKISPKSHSIQKICANFGCFKYPSLLCPTPPPGPPMQKKRRGVTSAFGLLPSTPFLHWSAIQSVKCQVRGSSGAGLRHKRRRGPHAPPEICTTMFFCPLGSKNENYVSCTPQYLSHFITPLSHAQCFQCLLKGIFGELQSFEIPRLKNLPHNCFSGLGKERYFLLGNMQ